MTPHIDVNVLKFKEADQLTFGSYTMVQKIEMKLKAPKRVKNTANNRACYHKKLNYLSFDKGNVRLTSQLVVSILRLERPSLAIMFAIK